MQVSADTTFCTIAPTPLGAVLLAANASAVTGLWFTERQRHLPSAITTALWVPDAEQPLLRAVMRWLEAYFGGENPAVDFAIAFSGSSFQNTVWQLLREVGYGSTTTYGELALKVAALEGRDRPPAARAIGGAVAKNPLSLVVPCHRVVGSGGVLTGYGGGLDRKEALLRLEGTLLL